MALGDEWTLDVPPPHGIGRSAPLWLSPLIIRIGRARAIDKGRWQSDRRLCIVSGSRYAIETPRLYHRGDHRDSRRLWMGELPVVHDGLQRENGTPRLGSPHGPANPSPSHSDRKANRAESHRVEPQSDQRAVGAFRRPLRHLPCKRRERPDTYRQERVPESARLTIDRHSVDDGRRELLGDPQWYPLHRHAGLGRG